MKESVYQRCGNTSCGASEINQQKTTRALQDNRESSVQLQQQRNTQQTVQRNNTGLPDNLKAGIENLSGYSMDDVKVHYNSPKPATLQAHAYAQGTDIHLASGQERHLPHEAWHVVQQKQGRVKPTLQMKEKANINDDLQLEREADVMGARALGVRQLAKQSRNTKRTMHNIDGAIQRAVITTPPDLVFDRNVAVAWKGGGAYADTPAIINGKVIPPSSNKEGMILEPRLVDVGGVWRTMPADQHVGCRIEAPGAGPWTFPTPVGLEELDAFARAGEAVIPERSATESSHDYTLIVHGSPSDGVLHQAIFTHELHHVEEQNEVIDNVLVPWDAQVTAQTASAMDPLSAGLAYDRLGIEKAQDVADTIVDQMRIKGLAFHDTDQGKEPDIANVVLDEPAQTYNVYLKPHVA